MPFTLGHFNVRYPVGQHLFILSLNYRSVLIYSPSSQQDYGTILCFANNAVGRQREPCQFHVIPAGKK